MMDHNYKDNNKKYRKYKKCTLPFYYYDEERKVSKWVFYNGECFRENNELYESFSEIINSSFSYNYEIALHYYDLSSNTLKTDIEILCSHNIDDVIEAVYTHPESFNIPKKYVSDYSKQEFDFLIRLKNYLLLIGLKDRTDSSECITLQQKYSKALGSRKYQKELGKLLEKEDFARVSNEKINRYRNILFCNANDDIIDAILSKKKKTRIFRQDATSVSRVGLKFFVLDNDNNYKALIEIIKEKIIPFKEFRDNSNDYILNGFTSFEDYKKHLFKEFSLDNSLNEKFTEDSLISIASFKIVEKF